MREAFVQPLHRWPGMLAEQGDRRTAMACARFVPPLAPFGAILRRQFGQFDQGIGDALHRRDHGDLHRLVACKQQLRHMPITLGICHRGAAEFVHDSARRGRKNSSGFERNSMR